MLSSSTSGPPRASTPRRARRSGRPRSSASAADAHCGGIAFASSASVQGSHRSQLRYGDFALGGRAHRRLAGFVVQSIMNRERVRGRRHIWNPNTTETVKYALMNSLASGAMNRVRLLFHCLHPTPMPGVRPTASMRLSWSSPSYSVCR